MSEFEEWDDDDDVLLNGLIHLNTHHKKVEWKAEDYEYLFNLLGHERNDIRLLCLNLFASRFTDDFEVMLKIDPIPILATLLETSRNSFIIRKTLECFGLIITYGVKKNKTLSHELVHHYGLSLSLQKCFKRNKRVHYDILYFVGKWKNSLPQPLKDDLIKDSFFF
jgi:hypothetical protein